jgi:hypothetical protein
MKNKLTTMAGIAAALIGFSATVQAVPTLTLADNNGNSISVNATGGVASYNGALGNWNINVSTGIANGTTLFPVLDLNSVDQFTSGLGNILTITFTDDNLGPLASSYLNAIGGTENGTADAFSVLVNGVLLSSSAQSFGITPFSGTASGAISGSFPTTLSLVAVLTAGSGGQTSFDDHLTVPDGGATVMMLGAALSAIGLLRKKMIA